MALYKVTDYETHAYNTPKEALASLEILIDTLDSTTNPIRMLKVVRQGDTWKGLVIYSIP